MEGAIVSILRPGIYAGGWGPLKSVTTDTNGTYYLEYELENCSEADHAIGASKLNPTYSLAVHRNLRCTEDVQTFDFLLEKAF